MENLISSLFSNVGLVELLVFIGGIVFFAARLEENSRASKELLNSELKHVRDLMELNHHAIKEDIARLEQRQSESNRVKERLAMQEIIVSNLQNVVDTLVRNKASQDND